MLIHFDENLNSVLKPKRTVSTSSSTSAESAVLANSRAENHKNEEIVAVQNRTDGAQLKE